MVCINMGGFAQLKQECTIVGDSASQNNYREDIVCSAQDTVSTTLICHTVLSQYILAPG